MSLRDRQVAQGAVLAPDNIPLHYGDVKSEYQAALETAVLMDRSHESRLILQGEDRIALLQRISTNDLLNLALNEGRPTVFTNPNGRILDRATVHNRGDYALLITEPNRGARLTQYLQRNLFFNDRVQVQDISSQTHLFALHGPQADQIMEYLIPQAAHTPSAQGFDLTLAGSAVFATRRKPVSSSHWAFIVPQNDSEAVWMAILDAGKAYGLIPAGSLAYNALRIRAGRPAAGRELSQDYIPLEAGLWDEVSFQKGCYIGQEIIARMESRNRLAKTLATFRLSDWIETPATIYHEEKPVGTLTSSVTTPDNELLGIGFIKPLLAIPGQRLLAGESRTEIELLTLAGTQPPQLTDR